MFTTYPVAVHYRRTTSSGPLRGQPLQCTVGVINRKAALDKIEEIKQRNDGSYYDNFSIDFRK